MSTVRLPSAMQVFERGWLSANNILFRDGASATLVDSGYATHADQTLALVSHALGGQALDRLINTHLHSDHCGGNAALQARYHCETLIPAAEAGAVRDWNQDQLTYVATGQQCPRFSFDGTLSGGDTLQLGGMDWEVLAAPGHDPHSLMLYCPQERLLISADALWENGFGVIFPELEGESGFAETRATLEMIARLDVRLVIPGHGSPFAEAGPALERAFARLDYLSADPARNAQNGVKVLVKFRLLERRQVPMSDLIGWFSEIPLLVMANRKHLMQDPASLAQWTAQQLVKAGVARMESGCLIDC